MLGNTNAIQSSSQATLNNLSISINGINKLTYNGKTAASLDITLALLGAAASNHNHDSVYSKLNHTHSYLPLSGGTMSGTIWTARHSIYIDSNNSGLEAGNDTSQLDKKNNLNINSWYGVSFSSDCAGAYQNLPTFTINCRNGDIRSRGIIYCNNIVGNGTTLSTNLNADLLDGKHASSFAASGHNHDSTYFKKNLGGINVDFNTLLTDGRYSGAAVQKANTPYPTTTVYGDLDVRVNGGGTHNNSSNWIWQTFYKTDSSSLFFRSKTNASAWNPWVVLSYQNSGPACMQSSAPGETRLLWAW